MIRKRAFGLLPRVFSFLRGPFCSNHRRTRALRLEPCETRNLLSAVSGTVFDDLTDDGFTPDDVPAGDVPVDLFQDNGNGFLDQPGDVLLDTQLTDPTTGGYTFGNLAEGRYHVRQRVPIGSRQSAGPEYYTFDVTGETVGLLIDNFESPDPADVYFISGYDLDPTHLEADDARILGGQRDLLVDVLGDANAVSASGMIGTYMGASNFQFASSASSPGTKAILQYDGIDGDIEGPPAELVSGSFSSPIDLTADGTHTGLRIDFDMIQVGEGLNLLGVDVRAKSVDGSATFVGMIPEFTTPTGYSIPFTSFAASGDFSFTELTSLEIVFNEEGVAAVDFQVDSIQAETPNGAGFDFANFTPTATVSGVKYDDLTGNGLTEDDQPLGGVTIDLFLDNGDGIFEEANDTWLRDTTTDDLTGSYNFEGLTDGTYHIREQVPAGMIRTFGPDAYTFDVVGGTVGLLIDNFDDPNPYQSYFINAFDSDPLHIETEGSGILGGQRDLLVDVLGDANFVSASGSIGFDNGVGSYQFASAAAAPGTMAVLQYDGLDVDPLGELEISRMMPAVDLTGGGLNTGLRLEMNMLQVGEQLDQMHVTVYVASSAGTASFVDTIPEGVDRFGHFIPFSAFSGTQDFSFTEVTSLEFRLNPSGVAAVDFQLDFIVAENPNESGFDFANFTVLPQIDIEKSTNGADADDPTGPMIPVGEAVTWTYVVTTEGNVSLGGITVTDDQGVVPVFLDGDSNSNGLLDVDETWTYEAAGISVLGQYSNISHAVGTPAFESGEPIEGFEDVADSDPSHYFGAATGITIEKSTDGRDADSPTGPILIPGEVVTWHYVIRNTGNIPLADITVTDDQGVVPVIVGGDINGNDLLDPNEIWTFEAEDIVVLGQYANLGTVVGTPVDFDGELIEGFDDVTDSDPSHYLAVTGGIHLEKATNGQDADNPTGPMISVGESVTWTYTVSNTGNAALRDVTLIDDQGVTPTLVAGDGNNNQLLDTNEIWIYEADGIAVNGQYANLGSVTGTPAYDGGEPIEGLDPVSDTDPSHYFGVLAGIHIEKATNGQDADAPTGPMIPVAEAVTWLYTVSNTGNVALGDIELTDDQGVVPILINGDVNGNQLLDTNEIWIYEADGIALAGQYANLGSVTGTPAGVDNEPIEGFELVSDTDPSHYFGVITGIHIEKATNGQDADTPTGPMVEVGEAVTWLYTVSNTGNVALSGIDLTDDQGVVPTLLSGDLNGNQLLDTSEIWIYEADGIALAGQYANLGSVAGTPADVDGEPIEGMEPVSDSDPSHYFGVNAGIHIEKTTNAQDADTPTGPMVPLGEAVTWLYTVSNTGNVALSDIELTDDQGVTPTLVGGDINGNQLLDTNEIWIFEADGIAVAGQYANVGTVIGTPAGVDNEPIEGFEPVSDTDPSHYFGVITGIHIEKATNGDDADTPTGPMVPVSDAITWLYTVSNTGNVALGDIDLTDDQGVVPVLVSGDVNGNQLLDTNELWIFEADGIALAGQYANLGSVTGTPVGTDSEPIEGFEPVSDTDPSHYFGVIAGIHIEKATNGQDADTPTGPMVPVGEAITWLYTVSNTGNVPLSDIDLTDDQGVVPVLVSGDVNSNQLLDTNEIWIFEAEGPAVAGQYANVGNVIGTPADVDGESIEGMEPVSSTDPSHYFGVNAVIDIEKATNGDDADTPTGPMVPIGDAITWVYTASNPGNVSLSDVTIADDQGVVPVFTGGDTNANDLLDAGEIWTYEADGIALAGQYANVGSITGTPVGVNNEPIEGFEPVSDTDPSHYFGVDAGIHIEKATNGQDADTPTGPTVIYGDTVTWDYVVTNPGNVPLADVDIIDDAGTPGDPADDFVPTFVDGDVNGDGLLDIDETWNYTASITSTQIGQYANLAEAVGTPANDGEPIPGMEDVWDDDPSHFFGQGLSSLSGYVYVDSNNNGWIDFNEVMLENAVVTLVGTDVLGNNVLKQTTTDAAGLYLFDELVPGTYAIHEMQPWAYYDGIDTIGTPGGVTSNDKFSDIDLPPNFDGVNNNFGERGLRIIVKNMLVWPLDAWRNYYDGSPYDPEGEQPPLDMTEAAPAPTAPVPAPPAPMIVTEDEAPSDLDAGLTPAELQPIITEAIGRWDDMEIDVDFSDVDFVITDLDDSLLGLTDGDTIYLDDDAAGQGWFIDQTPDRDEEFSDGSVDPRVVDSVDLLAVVTRQLGETLDLKDLDAAIEMLLQDRLQKDTPDQPSMAEVNMAFFRLM